MECSTWSSGYSLFRWRRTIYCLCLCICELSYRPLKSSTQSSVIAWLRDKGAVQDISGSHQRAISRILHCRVDRSWDFFFASFNSHSASFFLHTSAAKSVLVWTSSFFVSVSGPWAHFEVEFIADKAGVFPFYCTNFCSALHQEMQGYLLVKP